ncbi:MAG: acetylxylan esterase, partial [bacterium]
PPPPQPNQPPSWQEQVLSKGWATEVIIPNSYQADSGAGLRSGIIGLVNKGKLRKADDWGALKAWGWGASRALDYLETDPTINAKMVAIEGISRYGNAALVTMVYDTRFAAAFVGSSGAGGAKLWRRDFGEKETNLASSGEYHWMAPNFIKYAGPLTPADMPIDQHEFIALCAPRPTFIGCGSPNVEGIWVDDTGMFRATYMASPVWQLLGAKGIKVGPMPPEDQGLTDGELAFRQHSGGHTNGPNWPTFLDWLGRYFR